MGIIKKYLDGFQKPEGAMGRFILKGMNIGHTPLSKLALSQIFIAQTDYILDIGCGGGINIRRMLKKARCGKVYGIDCSEESVKMSREENADNLGSRCEIVHGSAENIPYADGTFDKVTAFETIYFWDNIEKCFAEVNRILKNDGTFLIACETSKGGEFWGKIVGGMRVYTPEQLTDLLTRAGFYNIKVHSRKLIPYVCITADKKPIFDDRETGIKDKIFKPKSVAGTLKPMYHKMLMPFIGKSLCKRIGKVRAGEILKNSKDEYRRLCASSPDLGNDNPFSYNAYFAYVYIAVWLASGKKLPPETVGEIMAENLRALKPLIGRINLNKPKGMQFAKKHMVYDYEKWYKLHGAKYPGTWHITTDDKKDGIYYELRNCPIRALCEKLGISEIMPAMCQTDYVMCSLMHGKLIRKQTMASGGEMCDYHIIGDGDTASKHR